MGEGRGTTGMLDGETSLEDNTYYRVGVFDCQHAWGTIMSVQERNRAIIDRWIEPSPAGLGPQDARLAEYGVSVWSLVAYSHLVNGDVARVAADYDLPPEAAAAAFAYYEAHRYLIDAQIALNEAAFAG